MGRGTSKPTDPWIRKLQRVHQFLDSLFWVTLRYHLKSVLQNNWIKGVHIRQTKGMRQQCSIWYLVPKKEANIPFHQRLLSSVGSSHWNGERVLLAHVPAPFRLDVKASSTAESGYCHGLLFFPVFLVGSVRLSHSWSFVSVNISFCLNSSLI